MTRAARSMTGVGAAGGAGHMTGVGAAGGACRMTGVGAAWQDAARRAVAVSTESLRAPSHNPIQQPQA